MRAAVCAGAALLMALPAKAQSREPARPAQAPLPALTDSGPPAPLRAVSACVVVRIVDGDTIRCRDIGSVRLIGLDAPEANQEPFGATATAALEDFLPVGITVQLEPDVDARDRYGRTLAYVWIDGVMVNWLMVRLGWAVTLTVPPNVQYVSAFTAAVQRARIEGLGLWQVDGFRCLPTDRRRKAC